MEEGVLKPNARQYRGAQVNETRIFRFYGFITENNTRNFRDIGTVVSAPGRIIIKQNLISQTAKTCFPGSTEVTTITYD